MGWFGWPPKDPPMFWITVAAFVAVCIYAAFAKQQVIETRKANEIADKAFFTANRPYLMWVDSTATPIAAPASPEVTGWFIGSDFRNLGKTPATRALVQFCDPIVRPNSTPPIFTCTISETRGRFDDVFGPDQQRAVVGPRIESALIVDTFTEKRFLYVFGYMTYHDNLLREETHTTRPPYPVKTGC
jgi:hypothetical protein